MPQYSHILFVAMLFGGPGCSRELAETKRELADAKQSLDQTRNELRETKQQLADAEAKVAQAVEALQRISDDGRQLNERRKAERSAARLTTLMGWSGQLDAGLLMTSAHAHRQYWEHSTFFCPPERQVEFP